MLALLLNMPRSGEDWARWSLHHRFSHDVIRQAIFDQMQINLPQYLLDPIPMNDTKIFLQRNASAHADMNGALGAQGSNLLDANLAEQRELQAWIYLHYLEHQTAETKLKVAS